MTQPIETGINLQGIPRTKWTSQLLDVAKRTGKKEILSENDLMSYGIYRTRFRNCGNDSSAQTEMCRQRVRRWDGDLVRTRQYEEKDVLRMLRQFTPREVMSIIQGAFWVAEWASRRISTMRSKTSK